MVAPYVPIQDVVPWTQAIAGLNQFTYSTNWTANDASDILVYARDPNIPASDILQLVDSSHYTVAFIGSDNIVQVTFIYPFNPPQYWIVTIMRNTPSEFLNLYTNTNFLPSMLNSDFETLTQIDQQNELYWQQIIPRYNNSATVNVPIDTILPVLGANQFWAKNSSNTAFIAVDVSSGGGGGAGSEFTYVTLQETPQLPNSFSLGSLTTGLLKNTVVDSIAFLTTAVNGTDYWAPGDILTIPSDPTEPDQVANKDYVDNAVAGIGGVDSGLINELAWYAASGNVVSGLATANSSIMVTGVSGIPGWSTTLPAFSLGGTLNTNDQTITNSLTNGNVLFSTNGTGLFNLNNTQGIAGVSNDGTMSADSTELVPTQAAVVAYVTTLGLGFKPYGGGPAVCSTTANLVGTYSNGSSGIGATITLTADGAFSADGVSPSMGAIVLVQFQTNAYENGIYTLTTVGGVSTQAVLTRSTAYDTTAQIIPGSLIAVEAGGALYGGSVWFETLTVTTIGTDSISFSLLLQPSNVFVTLTTNQAITGVKTFGPSALKISGSTSGSITLMAAAIAGSAIFTLPSTTDTLAGISATQTLTNKTISGSSNTLSNIGYASLANETAGSMLTWSALGVAELVSPGTSGYIWTSNGAGAAPSWQPVETASSNAPTIQKFTSGSGTYTTPTSPAPLYIKVKMMGGGGGGAGGGILNAGSGSAGGSSFFGSSLLSCTGGNGGTYNLGLGGSGGSGSITSPAYGFTATGGYGQGGPFVSSGGSTWTTTGGCGGNGFFGGGGGGGTNASQGAPGEPNSGGGGGGGGCGGTTLSYAAGCGGGAGGYVESFIASPSSTYSYTVGAGGSGGTANAYGGVGGAGGSGIIIVEEYYQ